MECLFDLDEHIRSAINEHMRAREVRPLLTLPGKRPRVLLRQGPPRCDGDLSFLQKVVQYFLNRSPHLRGELASSLLG